MKLDIRLTKISPTHHKFEAIREDGMREIAELETKSFLFHDLLHFAVESEAKLQHSFYGLLASGHRYAELSGKEVMSTDFGQEILHTERIVGALTGVMKDRVQAKDCLQGVFRLYAGYGDPMPEWFTEHFINKVKQRMTRLIGHWDGTEFGRVMELRFEV
jgi:hypothetical protein